MINCLWLVLYKVSKEELRLLIKPAAGDQSRELMYWQISGVSENTESYLHWACVSHITWVVFKSKSFSICLSEAIEKAQKLSEDLNNNSVTKWLSSPFFFGKMYRVDIYVTLT